ncbi:MAG: formate dehydrogenase accessory sulfurtransferase FdhD [Acidobacteriota bacterium]|jgi:FdhD protein
MHEENDEPSGTREREIIRVQEGGREAVRDVLAVEEPCEIRVGGDPVAVTMRTPGHDAELAAGFLFSEGIVQSDDIAAISHCAADRALHPENVVEVHLAPGRSPRRDLRRHFYASSSCGICGKASIEAIHVDAPALPDGPTIAARRLAAMVQRLDGLQSVFAVTGGLHAAAIFDPDGEPLVVREDVGRHNAVDKAIGYALLRERLPLDGKVLVVSGRTSFEILQKALVARIPIVAGVSAASSLAAEFAARSNMTLVGFLRRERMNVYAGAERIEQAPG